MSSAHVPEPVAAAAPKQDVKPEFGFIFRYVIADQTLRFGILFLLRMGWIGPTLFWTAQAGVMIALWALVLGHSDQFKRRYGLKEATTSSPAAMYTMVVLIAHAIYQIVSIVHLDSTWARITVNVLLAIGAVLHLMVLCTHSISDRHLQLYSDEPYDAIDENDRILIRLKTEVASQQRRVESYTVESTLIGALAFSAFVTIVSSDKGKVEGVREVIADLSEGLSFLLSLHVRTALAEFAKLSTEDTILATVATLSLTCSAFFLAVIAARLRFNTIVALADYSIEVASAFNEKEEGIFTAIMNGNASTEMQDRLKLLHRRISDSLEEARTVADQIRPIVAYMSVFRNLGVVCFLLALVTSALWVSATLAIVFFIISILAYTYSDLDRLFRDHKLTRHGFFRLPTFFKK